jgi:outer membrane lipoprotein SlyB
MHKSFLASLVLASTLTIGAAPAEPQQVRYAAADGSTRARYETVVQRRYVVKRRSKKKSVAIVGGSALGGAAIGGLAGGKKGAAIGAIAGGGAGFIYDRKTHKKVVRTQ